MVFDETFRILIQENTFNSTSVVIHNSDQIKISRNEFYGKIRALSMYDCSIYEIYENEFNDVIIKSDINSKYRSDIGKITVVSFV